MRYWTEPALPSEGGHYWYGDHLPGLGLALEQALFSIPGTAIRGRPDKPGTICVPGRKVYLHPVSAWIAGGDQLTESQLNERLDELEDAARAEGFGDTLPGSPGSICRDLIAKALTSARMTAQGPGARALCHAAVHQGPMVATVAGARSSALFDRNQAFLRALSEPVPVNLTQLPKATPSRLLGLLTHGATGFVSATVRIHPSFVPTLPANTRFGQIYGAGEVRGCWTLDLLRDELEAGRLGEVLKVDAVWLFQGAKTVHLPNKERIEAIKLKALRKALYTRYWGTLAGGVSWQGVAKKERPTPEHVRLPGSCLWWRQSAPIEETGKAPVWYRPCDAAIIASNNHIVMGRAIREAGEAVQGVLTDALLVDPEVWQPRNEGWKEEVRGSLRQWGTGNYEYYSEGGSVIRYRAMGCGNQHDYKARGEHYRKIRQRWRAWDVDPARDERASSVPLQLDESWYSAPVAPL